MHKDARIGWFAAVGTGRQEVVTRPGRGSAWGAGVITGSGDYYLLVGTAKPAVAGTAKPALVGTAKPALVGTVQPATGDLGRLSDPSPGEPSPGEPVPGSSLSSAIFDASERNSRQPTRSTPREVYSRLFLNLE
jgi:hypothetical protein